MKNISNNTLLFFYAIPGVTILSTLIILFFVGDVNTTETIKHAYIESDDNHMFILLSIIMIIWLTLASLAKSGLINSTFRSNLILVIIVAITSISFLYLGEFIGLISVPAIVYCFLHTRQRA